MDIFKRETVKGYTELDLNAKCVHNRNRHKDTQKIKRQVRRKNKQKLKKCLTFN